ncbi:MAG: putative Ig domain-containing protein [Nitrosarchaeum sp.]|nr:putative Ig domain-containing protein [Nitrosarchaeum sp.]
MRIELAVFLIFSLSVLMVVPAYADVTSLSLGENTYPKDGKFIFIGNENEGSTSVFVIVRDSIGEFMGMLSDPTSDNDGTFSTLPRDVSQFFKTKGFFNATAFTDDQKEENGITIKIEYDGSKIFVVPDFVLKLNTITDQIVEEKKTVTFTATLTNSLTDVVFSLEKNPPTGASIDSKTGKFLWTPTESQGPATYVFDIVVKKGVVEDRKTLKITVTEPAAPISQPKPEPKIEPEPVPEEPEMGEPEPTEIGLASFVDPTRDPQSYVDRYNNEPSYKKWFDENFPEYSSIYQAVGLEEPMGLASFVDPTRDPQSYVDRYNNEPSYKKWFDENFPEYSSIYQAVGLEEPKELAPFVDPNLDPQYYIDRYNNEPSYKKWFDENFPDMTIYDAVGLEESEIKEPESGQCGPGTDLVDGICTIVDSPQGGGCLIATAAYGSEMAPQVQFLREIRDSKVMSTSSGVSFMTGFNQFYYSFSPTIADIERENPMFKELVKIGITPMLTSLSIMSAADTEQEIVGYGIGVILMNIGMYFVAPIMLIFSIKKAKTRLSF